MNLTPEDFNEAGYTHYPEAYCSGADSLLQKAIWTECGTEKKYYINVGVYDWRQSIRSGDIPPSHSAWGFQPECDLYFLCKDGEEEPRWITLTYHNFKDINDLESFYERAYDMFECDPDVHNND